MVEHGKIDCEARLEYKDWVGFEDQIFRVHGQRLWWLHGRYWLLGACGLTLHRNPHIFQLLKIYSDAFLKKT